MPRPIKYAKSTKAARPGKPASKVPYPFVLDALELLHPEVRRMFSGFAIYSGNLLILMLRDRPTLRRDFPSLRRIELLEDKISHWLLIPSDCPTFEQESLHACNLLLRRDPRLGRIPKPRR